jgi:hypothetical protein
VKVWVKVGKMGARVSPVFGLALALQGSGNAKDLLRRGESLRWRGFGFILFEVPGEGIHYLGMDEVRRGGRR